MKLHIDKVFIPTCRRSQYLLQDENIETVCSTSPTHSEHISYVIYDIVMIPARNKVLKQHKDALVSYNDNNELFSCCNS